MKTSAIKKYASVFRTSFKQEKDAWVNHLIRGIFFMLMCYMLFELWGYIYGRGTGQIIKGFSLVQMLWYLIITETIQCSTRTTAIIREFSTEIKSGSIAYKLNKPYNYYLYTISSFMARSMFILIFIVPIAIIMGFCFVGIPITFVWEQILPCSLTILIAIFLSWSLYGIVGQIAFWTQEAAPFAWIVQKFMMLFGLLFPVDFFPLWMQPIIRYSPIYSIMSGPATLVANFSWLGFLELFISQLVWGIIIVGAGLLILKKGQKKVTSNGG